MMEVVRLVERKIQLEIPNYHWREAKTIGEFVDYIVSRLAYEKLLNKDNRAKGISKGIPKNWIKQHNAYQGERKPVYMK